VDDNVRDFDVYPQINPLLDNSKNDATSDNRITITSVSQVNYAPRLKSVKLGISVEDMTPQPTVI